MRFIVIIPARYASSRFPGKPLAKIGGVEMIVRVARQASLAAQGLSDGDSLRVAVATDDSRILRCVVEAGFDAVMTSAECRCGTDRVAQAYSLLGSDAEVVINVQGDEPFIHPSQIQSLMDCFRRRPDASIATLVRPFDKSLGFDALFSPNLVKVTFSDEGRALYFSRSIIPYVRGAEWKQWLDTATFHTHVGIYAYRADVLRRITSLPPSSLEKAESLEQLRWLQAGIPIEIAVTRHPTIGIDTPEDLALAESMLPQ